MMGPTVGRRFNVPGLVARAQLAYPKQERPRRGPHTFSVVDLG